MQRIFLGTALLIVIIIFALQGFRPAYEIPENKALASNIAAEAGGDPAKALIDIYFDVDMLGLKDVNPEDLELDLDIPQNIYTAVWGKYTDGRFGIADVIIVLPRSGREDAVREALQDARQKRIDFFQRFDVYNAYELAQNGVIFQRGDYYILTMIENSDAVRQILERHLPR